MAQRRGRGEGSIRLRADGRWEASIAVGDGPSKSHYAKTQREALRWLADAKRSIEQGAALPDERQTVAAYLATWLATVSHDLKPGTTQRHAEIMRLHLVPRLGRLKLAKLTPLQVQSLYSELLESGLRRPRWNASMLCCARHWRTRCGWTSYRATSPTAYGC